MAISMAGLASTMQGYQQADRQRQVDEVNTRKDQRDQWQFEQDKQVQEARAREDAVLNGEPGLSAVTPKAPAAASDQAAPVTQQPSAGIGAATPALAQPSAQAAPASPISYSKQMQQRVNDYAAKNPNDIKGITSMQDRIEKQRFSERSLLANKAHQEISLGLNPKSLVELYNEHVHDGRNASEIRYVDGNTLAVKFEDGAIETRPMKMTMDFLMQVQKPESMADIHLKKLEEQAKADGALPSQQALDNTKTDNKIKEATATGQIRKNDADAANSRSQAGLHAAQEEFIRSGGNGGLTLPQQRSNAEIDAARNTITGLSSEEIAHRMARATNTGRENKDFDSGLAKQVALAARRKVGSDDQFDQQSTDGSQVILAGKPIDKWADEQLQKVYGSASPAGKARIDFEVTRRLFSKDSEMAGNTLGKQTPNGFEVIDKTGKLIGHYTK